MPYFTVLCIKLSLSCLCNKSEWSSLLHSHLLDCFWLFYSMLQEEGEKTKVLLQNCKPKLNVNACSREALR